MKQANDSLDQAISSLSVS